MRKSECNNSANQKSIILPNYPMKARIKENHLLFKCESYGSETLIYETFHLKKSDSFSD